MNGRVAARSHWSWGLVIVLLYLSPTVLSWHLPNRPYRRLPYLDIACNSKGPKQSSVSCEHELVYSPNFHRHLVVKKTLNGTRIKRNVVQSFFWLDEAQEAFPFASAVSMDLPPPPPQDPPPSLLAWPLSPSTRTESSNSRTKNSQSDAIVSMVVAGSGLNETNVYYQAEKLGRNETKIANRLENGASYLLKFLHKLQPIWPAIRPAQVHRDILNRFPRLALYDAALVHERLFFLLSPLPPQAVIDEFIESQSTNGRKSRNRQLTKSSSQSGDPRETTSLRAVDWPVLFHERGFGVGLTPFQLLRALHALPEYWLPLYLNDASSSMKQPHKLLPYIFSQMKFPSETMRDVRRELDPWLTGACPADVGCIAHAKSALDLSWLQCKILVQSMPAMLSCDPEPGWELFGSGPVRSVLLEASLSYLRLRLQLAPFQVHGLIMTHSRLSSYKVQSNLKPTLDALQQRLNLKSEELQRLILRMPSLLGMSTASFDGRIHFLVKKAGLTPDQVRKSTLQLPALLQYSESNLDAKLAYFHDDLQIKEPADLAYVFSSNPFIWGLSLENNLKPTVLGFAKACRMPIAEVGQVIALAPDLLNLNWSSNLKPTLEYLEARLNLTPDELQALVKATPRVLLHSINKSLEVKLKMIEQHFREIQENVKSSRRAVIDNPSLLLVTRSALVKRLQKAESYKTMLALGNEYMGTTVRTPASSTVKSGKIVRQLLSNSSVVVREYLSVKEAASTLGTSVGNMYYIIRRRRVFRGMHYEYAVANDDLSTPAETPDKPFTVGECKSANNLTSGRAKASFLDDIRRKHIHDDCQKTLMQCLGRVENDANETSGNPEVPRLVVYASGRVYPPDASTQGRGRKRAGGMAISIPSLPKSFGPIFDKACRNAMSQIMKIDGCGGDSGCGFVVAFGYPYLRPSRRRVSLAVCRDALRVVSQLFLLVAEASKGSRSSSGADGSSCPPPPMHVDVITDSNYAGGILSKSQDLLEWASQPTKDDYDRVYGKCPYFNHDILYPLSLTYSKLVRPQGPVAAALQGNLTVSFVQESGRNKRANSSFQDRMAEWATEAAAWQYQRSR